MTERRRADRLERQLRAEISTLIESEVDDPRVRSAVVTGIHLSKDLGHARVFVHSPGPESQREELLKGLESARGFLRRRISQRLSHLRRTPELTFAYDTSFESGIRVEELLAELESEDGPAESQ